MCYTGQHSKFVVVVVALSLYHHHQHNQHHELTVLIMFTSSLPNSPEEIRIPKIPTSLTYKKALSQNRLVWLVDINIT